MEDKKNKKSVFATLYAVNVNDKTEKKNGLTYLSWAFAWGEVKKAYPDAIYRVYENADGWNYFTDGRTCWVKTSVTIEGIENIEYLPVMDYRNNSIPADKVTSMDVNKAIQRSLTKCCARHGLGLYIYAGEDLPDSADEEKRPAPSEPSQAVKARRQASGRAAAPKYTPVPEEAYWKIVEAYALGRPTKTGGEYRSTWIHTTHAGEEQIAKFDHDVENFKMANNL
jgi:hypothetical protein